MILKDICDIKIGCVLGRAKADIQGINFYNVLTLKSVQDDEISKNDLDPFWAKSEIKDDFISKEGDVVVRLREPLKSIFIAKEYKDILIPSLFAIIRVKDEKRINPEYISLYLNSNEVKKQLFSKIQGSAINTVSLQNLSEVDIKIPNVEKQEQLINLNKLLQKERRLLDDLKKKRDILFENLIRDI